MERGIKKFHSPNWVVGERAGINDEVSVKLVLKHDQDRVNLLEEKLMEVSDPRSPMYGKHLTVDEVKDVLSLSPHVTYDVSQQLAKYNVTSTSINRYGDIISLGMNAKEVSVSKK